MRKAFGILTILLLFLTPAALATEAAASEGAPDIVITEGNFIYQLNLMEADPDDYAGQTVSIEGLFGVFTYGQGENETTYYKVYRYYPGDCCTLDETGLEVIWPDNNAAYPEDGAWVRAQGTLETYELDGVTYLQASLSQLEETQEPEGGFFVLE